MQPGHYGTGKNEHVHSRRLSNVRSHRTLLTIAGETKKTKKNRREAWNQNITAVPHLDVALANLYSSLRCYTPQKRLQQRSVGWYAKAAQPRFTASFHPSTSRQNSATLQAATREVWWTYLEREHATENRTKWNKKKTHLTSDREYGNNKNNQTAAKRTDDAGLSKRQKNKHQWHFSSRNWHHRE